MKGSPQLKTSTRLRPVSAAVVLATAGGFLAASPASAATPCKTNHFTRTFYPNTTFSGTPKKTDCDNVMDQNWGTRAPASGLPTNNFGVRYSLVRDFGNGGPFTFTTAARDGVRVYLDGVRKINIWKNVSTTQKKTVNVTIPSGKHTLRIDYVNWTGAANVSFAYAPRTSAAVDKTKPRTPAYITATYNTTTTKSTVRWSSNVDMDLAGYRVYRRLKGTTVYTKIAQTKATSYVDTPRATGQVFYYEARAYDKAGNESTGTTDLPVTTADKTAPARVIPSVTMGTDQTRESYLLTWKAVPDAARYRVLRLVLHSGVPRVWTEVARTTGTTHTDYVPALGANIAYRVEAYDTAGNAAPASADDESYPNASWHPRLNDVTISYQGNNTAFLQWTQPLDTFAIRWSDYRLHRTLSTVRPSGEATDSPEHCLSLTYQQEAGPPQLPLHSHRYAGSDEQLHRGALPRRHDARTAQRPHLRGGPGRARPRHWFPEPPRRQPRQPQLGPGCSRSRGSLRDTRRLLVPGNHARHQRPVLLPQQIQGPRRRHLNEVAPASLPDKWYVIVAVAADGTKKTLEQSPRISSPMPATD